MSQTSPKDNGQPKRNRPQTMRFLVVFFGVVAAFYALTLSPWVDAKAIYPVMKASASETSVLLNLIGTKTIADGIFVRGADFTAAVRRGCDPLEPIVLLAAAIIAFPAPLSRKLLGIAAGGTILFAMNLVRICTLYLLGAAKSPLFNSFHLFWWPALFIISALALWLTWLLWIEPSCFGLAKKQRAP